MSFPTIARGFAAVLLVFFVSGFIVSATGADLGDTIMGLVQWGGHHGRAYELMIETIYIAWALFLWRAAADPARNSLFMDFTVVGNAAHFAMMGIMSFTFDGEHQHIYGDVLAGFAALAVFTVAWLRARPAYLTTPAA